MVRAVGTLQALRIANGLSQKDLAQELVVSEAVLRVAGRQPASLSSRTTSGQWLRLGSTANPYLP